MGHRQGDETASINRRDTGTVLADYGAWLDEQPLSSRTREAYLAAVTAFVAWLDQRDAGPGDALAAPRARDLAARDYKRHMKVDRGLSPASVNQALAGMDNVFRFLGLGAAIVGREELPRAAPRALDVDQQRSSRKLWVPIGQGRIRIRTSASVPKARRRRSTPVSGSALKGGQLLEVVDHGAELMRTDLHADAQTLGLERAAAGALGSSTQCLARASTADSDGTASVISWRLMRPPPRPRSGRRAVPAQRSAQASRP
jgi:Phage integrase, N-terminal SAM-like domain